MQHAYGVVHSYELSGVPFPRLAPQLSAIRVATLFLCPYARQHHHPYKRNCSADEGIKVKQRYAIQFF